MIFINRLNIKNSKNLIQFNNKKSYALIDLTASFPLNETALHQLVIPLQERLGLIHLSQSIIIAGLRGDNGSQDVCQLHQNHSVTILPSMKQQRRQFPLVEFKDGQIILALCGKDENSNPINQCQKMNKFKKWTDLPNTNQKMYGVSACSVGLSLVYIFGQKPKFESILCLDLQNLDKKWKPIQCNIPENLLCRTYDTAHYIEANKKILIFGSFDGPLTLEIDVQDDHSLKMSYQSSDLPFDYSYNDQLMSKQYRGTVFCVGDQNIWKYNLNSREWERTRKMIKDQ